MNPSPALAPGASIGGRWQVAAFIGRGELGEVYAVRDPLSGQSGALKRFTPALNSRSDAWAAFEATAKAVAALPFDVFAKRIDSGKEGAPWIVTDRIIWPSLLDQVRAGGALPAARLAAMLEVLAPALDAAHAAGLVHRDLKPGNVFVEPAEKPTVHVTDFGAWQLRAALALPPGWAATPGWLGPDAADPAEASTPQMDVFALGLVVFHALTGRCRFPAAEYEPLESNALWAQMLEPIGSASALAMELGVSLDAAFDDWFSRALAPRPQERFQSIGAMAQAFGKAVQNIGAAARVAVPSGVAPPRQPGIAPPPPSGPAPEPRPRARMGSLHEPVAMVSSQPLAYLRMPTRPPPEAEPEPAAVAAAAAAPVPAAPAMQPAAAAPGAAPAAAPQTMPAPAMAPAHAADAVPNADELAAFGVPKKRSPVVPLAIVGGIVAVVALVLLVPRFLARTSAAPDSSGTAPGSAAARSSATSPASAAAEAGAASPGSASAPADAAPPSPATVTFECEPTCERVECDGREVQLDGGAAPLDPGPHRCTATRRGYLPSNDRFDVDPGEKSTRHIKLTKLRPQRPPAPAHTAKKKPCGTFINPCK